MGPYPFAITVPWVLYRTVRQTSPTKSAIFTPLIQYIWSSHRAYSKSKDQPGKVANPARGKLNREKYLFAVSVGVLEFGLARRVLQSRSASACSSPFSGFLTYEIPFRVPRRRPTPSGQSRVYRVTQLRTDSVHYQESASTGPVNLKVCCCCCFSPSAYWLPTRKKLLYTVAKPARGLLNREKSTKEKVWQHTPPPPPPTPPNCSFGEK